MSSKRGYESHEQVYGLTGRVDEHEMLLVVFIAAMTRRRLEATVFCHYSIIITGTHPNYLYADNLAKDSKTIPIHHAQVSGLRHLYQDQIYYC